MISSGNNNFDLVISLGTLHNLTLKQISNALKEITRVGKQGYIMVESYKNEQGSIVHELNGPLFFSSVRNFNDLFDPKNDDADDIILDFKNSRVYDHSAIEAIDSLAERYIKAGKTLHLRHLSEECKQLLNNAADLIEVNVMEDPHYHIADDKLA